MSALSALLETLRTASMTEREKGTYFEDLITCYLRTEATYQDLYSDVWTYADWADLHQLDKRDTGIDLVAKTRGTDEFHAIQCKFFAPTAKVQKSDIDSFFTASGKRPFTHRVIVSTTNNWTEHARDALQDQQPPVSKIDLTDLENSQIDWSRYQPHQQASLKPKKTLRAHQSLALDRVERGLSTADRGKLIMACGTGKTFTSLKIAEALAGRGRRVLFLVPSLSLLSQTLTEWTQESDTPLHSFAVCSDADVGKKRRKDDDGVQTFTHELRYPATTNPARLAAEMAARHDDAHMSVVFSTYHSIDVISQAQLAHGLADFDLIICDEAHRTTGATFDGDDESAFVRVHDGAYIRGAKRLYMTATPRIYGEAAKKTAATDSVTLCSMDDEALYGRELHVITFSEAVQAGLLVDYKVIVLAMDEKHVSTSLQRLLKDDENQIKVEDAAKIVGCWKALSKHGTQESLSDDAHPMKRAVAFCQVIEMQHKGKTHKVSSKKIATIFERVVEEYKASNPEDSSGPEEEHGGAALRLRCEASHVDGGMTASEKEEQLAWLKAETPEDTCRVLSNVRCLSEGVDVPALDAVLFLTPRNSQIDVVQSVGRVMRKAPGKTRGYVILPVVIPADMTPEAALNDNQTYKVVWQVLQALRSHDDRFDAHINKLDLNGPDPRRMEVIAVSDTVARKSRQTKSDKDRIPGGSFGIGAPAPRRDTPVQTELQFEIGEIERAIYAKVVEKCGNRHHWEDWAGDIAKIARTHITRITTILDNPANTRERQAFADFARELRDDLNDSITDPEIIEMLAQHLITKPVFDALFADYSFASHNPISRAMQATLDVLQEHRLDSEADTLHRFYASVQLRAQGIDRAEGKQKIIVELYDKFFRNAFPRMTERLGIVYTPVEVVDFIIHSVNHLLQQDFGTSLGSPDVHILDPFTGTGTFITRLMSSGLLTPDQLRRKYNGQIHANELVLLAYYIAAINIEAVYHSIVGGDYQPFPGICLTDTFQLYEKDDLVSALLVDNSARRVRQKALDIRVILGNPPYSVGQKSENDNNANVAYPSLDGRIRETYAARTNATLKNSLYDSYIRAIRWASDRIGDSGIIGFVTNAGFIESKAADGLRKCLSDEFSSLYLFHLRGNARTSGELRRKEGGNAFDSGSRAPIAISLLVKNPDAARHGQIYFHDIGDYLTRDQKLERITTLGSIAGITQANGWQQITPDDHGDWLKQRDDSFAIHWVMGDKGGEQTVLFANYSSGVKTQRDAWCYNASRQQVTANIQRTIATYSAELDRLNAAFPVLDRQGRKAALNDLITSDQTKISWTVGLKKDLAKGKTVTFDPACLTPSLYRPFSKQWLYFNRQLNERVSQMPCLFPYVGAENLVLQINEKFNGHGQIALMSAPMPDLHSNGDSQCFPLYLYDPIEPEPNSTADLFAPKPGEGAQGFRRRDAITDDGLAHFQAAYPGERISKEDLFYYIYGLLHSPEYRSRFADNLSKELPRIPRVTTAAAFRAFSRAGRDLAALHVGYETVEPYPGVTITGETPGVSHRVEKMRYGGKGGKDRTILHYNDAITVSGIPLAAYDYVVNGKPALDWVVERQCVKTDKDSGIVNDANDWAEETMDNPRYPLELFLRVITVSLSTQAIVSSLPPLEI